MKIYKDGEVFEGAGNLTGGTLTFYKQKFDSKFEENTPLFPTKYRGVHHPWAQSVVDDPILGPSRKVLLMACDDTIDADTQDPINKCRVQLDQAFQYGPGADLWIGFGVLFPADMPPVASDGWFLFSEVHGPPFNGGSFNDFAISTSQNMTFSAGKWSVPLIKGSWIDFVLHLRLANSDLKGFAELWMNTGTGWNQQVFKNGALRRRYKTIDTPNINGFNCSQIKHYRHRGMAGWGTVNTWFAEHRIGTSFEEVKPHSYGS